LKLGVKLLLNFLLVAFLVVIVGVVSRSYNDSVKVRLSAANQQADLVVEYASAMERNLFQSLIFVHYFHDQLHEQESARLVSEGFGEGELRNRINQEFASFQQNYRLIENLLGSRENEDAAAFFGKMQILQNRFGLYKELTDQILQFDEDDSAEISRLYKVSLEPYFRNNIIPAINELRNAAREHQSQVSKRFNQSLENVNKVTTWATVLAVIVAFIIVAMVNKSIVKPLNDLSKAAIKIGEGNFRQKIEVTGSDEIGQLGSAFNTMVENLDQRTISRNFLDRIIESMHEALFVTDEKGNIIRANGSALQLLGYDSEELKSLKLSDICNDCEQSNELYVKSVETELSKKNGDKVPVLASKSRLEDVDDKQSSAVFVASDITDQKQNEDQIRKSLEEKQVLLAEIHHRVKNNLAVISGLLHLQGWNSEDKEAKRVLRDSELRVQSISLVHEMLYQSDSLAYIRYDEYVKDLLEAISKMYADMETAVKIQTSLEKVEVNVNQAIPCSLLLNEIVVNAYKHAFNGLKKGIIHVKLTTSGDEVELCISDNGNGLDEQAFNESESLGVTLIKTLTKQLKGEFSIQTRESEPGSVFIIKFPQESLSVT